jgi:uncharacterized protein DUF4266
MNGWPHRSRRLVLQLLLTLLAFELAGCAEGPRLGAKPWDRGELARRCMRFDGYALEGAIDDHIYFSKEASSGGAGYAGGGCGCN